MREGQADVSRETPDSETGQTGGQYSGETGGTGGQWLRRTGEVRRSVAQVRQARQALRRSVAQVHHIAVGAPLWFGTSLCKKRAILS